MAVTGNQLLDVLAEPVQRAILNAARLVDLPAKEYLFRTREVPTHAHFLLSGVASMVISMTEGGSVEVGMVGAEVLSAALP